LQNSSPASWSYSFVCFVKRNLGRLRGKSY
jgi:hypothetical protein